MPSAWLRSLKSRECWENFFSSRFVFFWTQILCCGLWCIGWILYFCGLCALEASLPTKTLGLFWFTCFLNVFAIGLTCYSLFVKHAHKLRGSLVSFTLMSSVLMILLADTALQMGSLGGKLEARADTVLSGCILSVIGGLVLLGLWTLAPDQLDAEQEQRESFFGGTHQSTMEQGQKAGLGMRNFMAYENPCAAEKRNAAATAVARSRAGQTSESPSVGYPPPPSDVPPSPQAVTLAQLDPLGKGAISNGQNMPSANRSNTAAAAAATRGSACAPETRAQGAADSGMQAPLPAQSAPAGQGQGAADSADGADHAGLVGASANGSRAADSAASRGSPGTDKHPSVRPATPPVGAAGVEVPRPGSSAVHADARAPSAVQVDIDFPFESKQNALFSPNQASFLNQGDSEDESDSDLDKV